MQSSRAGFIRVNLWGKRVSPISQWKLGPRGDWVLEVGQWSVCLFESKKKNKRTQLHTIQCVTVTAMHRTGMREEASFTI